MSRHRNAMRKVSICDDDYDDDIAQSYDDTYGVSPGTSNMYTFNRNKESTSLSQFMASGQKILEDDDESQNEDMNLNPLRKSNDSNHMDHSHKSKANEDFYEDMFAMDKEPHITAIKKIDVDLDHLLMNKNEQGEIEEEHTDFDLNSLAEQYQNSKKQTSPISNILLKTNPSLDTSKPLSSSIDKLLDSFFSKNFEEPKVKENGPKMTEMTDLADFGFNLNMNSKMEDSGSELDLNGILSQRTQSIEINIEKTRKSPTQRKSNVFSLSDLANEYLSGTDDNNTPKSNLVDLIGSEFTDILSLNNKSTNNFDLDSEMEKIDFSTENLLIQKPDRKLTKLKNENSNRLSSSLTLKSNMSNFRELSDMRRNSYDITQTLADKINTKRTSPHNLKLEKFSFILNDDQNKIDKILENVHGVSENSLFGEFLGTEFLNILGANINLTNALFESEFSYVEQKKFLDLKKFGPRKQKKISINCYSKSEKRLKLKAKLAGNTQNEYSGDITNQVHKTARVHKVSSSSSTSTSLTSNTHHINKMSSHTRTKNHGKHTLKSKHGSGKDNKKILIFDFSIPSPDDIVIAKQKFAFKNMRFK